MHFVSPENSTAQPLSVVKLAPTKRPSAKRQPTTKPKATRVAKAAKNSDELSKENVSELKIELPSSKVPILLKLINSGLTVRKVTVEGPREQSESEKGFADFDPEESALRLFSNKRRAGAVQTSGNKGGVFKRQKI